MFCIILHLLTHSIFTGLNVLCVLNTSYCNVCQELQIRGQKDFLAQWDDCKAG